MNYYSSSKVPFDIATVLALIMAALLVTSTSFAADKAKPKAKPAAAAATAVDKPEPVLSAEEFRQQADWRAKILAVPQPKKGCFTAKFPSLEWQEIPCVAGPNYPMPPRSGIIPEIVGNGDDIAAQAPSGIISSATGSFDSLTNVTSLSGPIGNAGPSLANTYTLQLNTDFFQTSVCSVSPNAQCRGWEQFVFENRSTIHRAFIQYWLINFDTTCPANFTKFPTGATTNHCVQLSNLSGAVPTTAVPVTNLGQVSLTGAASVGADSVTVIIGGTVFSRAGDNSVNASSGWKIAEFNLFGDGGDSNGVGGTASFNNTASLVIRTQINFGGNAPPICVATGFTAEKNNLSFGPTAPAGSQPGPALIFTASIAGGSPSNCAAATAVGDTHLTTLSGLLYDFQATGDFELLETKAGFVVRQFRSCNANGKDPDGRLPETTKTSR